MLGVYTKFIVAAVGGAVTALLAIVPPQTATWSILTALSAALTAGGVYILPNAKP